MAVVLTTATVLTAVRGSIPRTPTSTHWAERRFKRNKQMSVIEIQKEDEHEVNLDVSDECDRS
jgi:hypothetical protein